MARDNPLSTIINPELGDGEESYHDRLRRELGVKLDKREELINERVRLLSTNPISCLRFLPSIIASAYTQAQESIKSNWWALLKENPVSNTSPPDVAKNITNRVSTYTGRTSTNPGRNHPGGLGNLHDKSDHRVSSGPHALSASLRANSKVAGDVQGSISNAVTTAALAAPADDVPPKKRGRPPKRKFEASATGPASTPTQTTTVALPIATATRPGVEAQWQQKRRLPTTAAPSGSTAISNQINAKIAASATAREERGQVHANKIVILRVKVPEYYRIPPIEVTPAPPLSLLLTPAPPGVLAGCPAGMVSSQHLDQAPFSATNTCSPTPSPYSTSTFVSTTDAPTVAPSRFARASAPSLHRSTSLVSAIYTLAPPPFQYINPAHLSAPPARTPASALPRPTAPVWAPNASAPPRYTNPALASTASARISAPTSFHLTAPVWSEDAPDPPPFRYIDPAILSVPSARTLVNSSSHDTAPIWVTHPSAPDSSQRKNPDPLSIASVRTLEPSSYCSTTPVWAAQASRLAPSSSGPTLASALGPSPYSAPTLASSAHPPALPPIALWPTQPTTTSFPAPCSILPSQTKGQLGHPANHRSAPGHPSTYRPSPLSKVTTACNPGTFVRLSPPISTPGITGQFSPPAPVLGLSSWLPPRAPAPRITAQLQRPVSVPEIAPPTTRAHTAGTPMGPLAAPAQEARWKRWTKEDVMAQKK